MNQIKVVQVSYITDKGRQLVEKLFSENSDILAEIKSEDEKLSDFFKRCFEEHQPIVFIGAVGIAVRLLSPCIQNKLKDIPVVVIDELGHFVIPILSGHYGGSNDLAALLAKRIGATAVITTATDINRAFAIDVFARKNGLVISEKEKIKKISSKVLRGEKVRFICDLKEKEFVGEAPAELSEINMNLQNDGTGLLCIPDFYIGGEKEKKLFDDALFLYPKRMVLGMGCKKGKSFEQLKAFVLEQYDEEELSKNLYAICSIDVKSSEIGLLKLCQYFGVKLLTFSSEELEKAEGNFEESDFVKSKVGVGNVCERAAVLGAGQGAELLKTKTSRDGMTLAEAKRRMITITW